jgi:DNA-binding GntR family transcriptional regulator
MEPISIKPDLTEQVYTSIRDAICDGQFRPLQRLNQDDLAATLQVSRQPIVQAIQLLKSQGFVKDTGRRGVEVTELTVDSASHYYSIRGVLDGLAARQAAERNHAGAEEAGMNIIASGRQACRSGNHHDILIADQEFHQFIYELSGNPVILKTVTPLWHQLRRIMSVTIMTGYPVDSIWDEHLSILEAIMSGDALTAETRARAHVEAGSTRVVNMLQQQSNSSTRPDQ